MLWQLIWYVGIAAAACWLAVGIWLVVREVRSERRAVARIQRARRARYASGNGGRAL